MASPADGIGEHGEFLDARQALDDADEVGQGASRRGGAFVGWRPTEAEVIAVEVSDNVLADAPRLVLDLGDDRGAGRSMALVQAVDVLAKECVLMPLDGPGQGR